jgi:hypothetical protein
MAHVCLVVKMQIIVAKSKNSLRWLLLWPRPPLRPRWLLWHPRPREGRSMWRGLSANHSRWATRHPPRSLLSWRRHVVSRRRATRHPPRAMHMPEIRVRTTTPLRHCHTLAVEPPSSLPPLQCCCLPYLRSGPMTMHCPIHADKLIVLSCRFSRWLPASIPRPPRMCHMVGTSPSAAGALTASSRRLAASLHRRHRVRAPPPHAAARRPPSPLEDLLLVTHLVPYMLL